jgi:acyl-CoA synthetase (AMP-forming)/AMP-acid ligase II
MRRRWVLACGSCAHLQPVPLEHAILSATRWRLCCCGTLPCWPPLWWVCQTPGAMLTLRTLPPRAPSASRCPGCCWRCRLGELVAALVVLQPGWIWQGPLAAVAPASGSPAALPQPAAGPREPGGIASPQALQDWCRQQQLTAYKLPRFFAALPQPLPLTASGKVQKGAVQEALAVTRQHSRL